MAPVDVLGPEEELIAGRRPVEEAFAAGRPAIRLLVTPARREPLERLVLHATRLRIPIVEVEGGTLTAVAGFDGHQGVALVVGPREWSSVAEILSAAESRGQPPFVLVMDSLEDPQNVGTLLRTAEAGGVHGVVFPTHRQAPLTPAAIKASAGAVEHLRLAPVDDLAGALADLHVRGVRVIGADGDAPLTARQADLRGPIALVVGSEGRGLGAAVRRRCDLLVRIPMRGRVGSLNASVAGSILVYEALAQRDPDGLVAAETSPPLAAPVDDLESAVAASGQVAEPAALPAEAIEAPEPLDEDLGLLPASTGPSTKKKAGAPTRGRAKPARGPEPGAATPSVGTTTPEAKAPAAAAVPTRKTRAKAVSPAPAPATTPDRKTRAEAPPDEAAPVSTGPAAATTPATTPARKTKAKAPPEGAASAVVVVPASAAAPARKTRANLSPEEAAQVAPTPAQGTPTKTPKAATPPSTRSKSTADAPDSTRRATAKKSTATKTTSKTEIAPPATRPAKKSMAKARPKTP